MNFSQGTAFEGEERAFRVRTPVGILDIEQNQFSVTGVTVFDPDITGPVDVPEDKEMNALNEMMLHWFRPYFARGTVTCTPLLQPGGTEFQRTIWKELQKIPAGETRTYGEVAAAVGKNGAAQAVGQACRQNPILILIPCHRVVPAGSGIGNYSGPAGMKATLLTHEGATAGAEPRP